MNYTIHNATGDISFGQHFWEQYQGEHREGPIEKWIPKIRPWAMGVLLDDESGTWDQSRGDISKTIDRELAYAKAIRSLRPDLKICNFARCREAFPPQIHAWARFDKANKISESFIAGNYASGLNFATGTFTTSQDSFAVRSLDRDCDFIPARLYVPESLPDAGLSFLYAARAVLADAAVASYLSGKPIMAILMPKLNGPKEIPMSATHHAAINRACDEFGVKHRMLWWNPERSNDPVSREYMIQLVKDMAK